MALIKDISSIAEMFLAVTDHYKSSKKDAYRRKVEGKWVGTSYADLYEQVEALALGLRSLGLSHGDRIGLLSENRLEWVVTDFACACSGFVDVSVFPILTAKQVEYVFNNAEVKIAFCSNKLQLGKLLKVAEEIPSLEKIVVFQKDAIEAMQGGAKKPLVHFAEILEEGRKLASAVPGQLRQLAGRVTSEDLLTLIYTSGTTGNPKGVMLTHGNLAANLTGISHLIDLTEEDVVLSYLPLCHSYERTAGYYTCFGCGVTTAFADSIETVPANLVEVRPTLLTSVPRLFERIKGRIEKGVQAGPEKNRKIFYRAVAVGVEHYRTRMKKGSAGLILSAKYAIADRLVFSKVREKIGVTRLRFFVSGGGPLPADVAEFFFALGIHIIEGYGLTESSPVISANPAERPKIGTVGLPLFNVEVKIDPDGEILTRGPHVMRGYYKDPAATEEAIDSEGWLHTGDIGRFDEDGYLKITDRKKNILVSSGGKNIAPQPIENLLAESPLIDQVMLVGDNRPFVTALVVPDYEALREIAESMQKKVGDLGSESAREELLDFDPVVLAIDSALKDLQRDLAGYERVRRYRLLSEPFTVENGMMTPTLKVKRKVVEERYRDEIEKMYEGVEMD
jgi:long-chain acyl-CoA synthetase